jgi:hypothetical protein
VVFSWLICGDSLVDCGGLTRTFRLRRIFHFFNFIFLLVPFRDGPRTSVFGPFLLGVRDGSRISCENGTYWIRYRLYTQ